MSEQQIDIKELNEKIQRESSFIDLLSMEMKKSIVGQKDMVERLLIGLFLGVGGFGDFDIHNGSLPICFHPSYNKSAADATAVFTSLHI